MSYNKDTWNYDYPINLWEEMPWQIRWPFAIAASIYFGGAFLIPLIIGN